MTRVADIFASDPAAILARHRVLLTKSCQRRAVEIGAPAALGLATLFAIWWLDISFAQIGPGLAELAKFAALMVPPSTGGHLPLFLTAMAETLAIAFLGTLGAAIVAAPLSLLAAKNTTPSLLLRFAIRRLLDTIRGIDTLIWALVFVGVVGLGPFAGILAIAVSDAGSFGKLFSEAIEATRGSERETVIASGGNRWMGIRFGLLPQVLPVIAGQVLYYFESNTRSATIIGIVGAGGIGLQLSEQIRTYDFDQVSFVVLLILATVAAIDWISGKLRAAMIGRKPALAYMRGTLVLVVGPSGAGKDSIIAGAASRLRGDPRVIFARRVITRPVAAGGETHLAVSLAEFAALRERRRLMLHWQAHGCEYGLPHSLAEALEYGHGGVANVSRTVVAEARRQFAPVRVIAVTASPATLARRLAGRGRETLAEIDRRLQRVGAISPDHADFVINNDGPLEMAVERFIALLREVADQPTASG